MVRRHSRKSGSGRETLPEVWKRSGDLPKVLKWSETFRRSGSARETLLEAR